MSLIVVINAFNEARNIAKCIGSVHEYVDEIWLFDGAYVEYPHESPVSTDGMLEIASQFPKVKIFDNNGKPWANQLEKRTAMFQRGKPGDVFFKLDGDEYVTNGELLRQYTGCDVGWAWTLSNLYRQPVMVTRFFKYRPGMHYAGRHHWLFDGNNTFITSDQHMNLRYKHIDTPIRVFNFRDSSRPERLGDKKAFLKNRSVYECQYQSELEVYDKPVERFVSHPNRAGKPSPAMTCLRYSPDVDYTLTLMFSRPWAISSYFNAIKKLAVPANTEMIVVIDTDLPDFVSQVVNRLSDLKQFTTIKYYVTGNPKLPEFKQVAFRRQRIIDNWHVLLTEARGKIILGSEDDSLPANDAYLKLLKDMETHGVDFVQGNIVGRWAANMIPAWHVYEKDGQPYKVESGSGKGVEEINGMGWYCFVATADAMRKLPMRTDDLLPLGPDVRFGYDLSKNGFKLFHDYDVDVIHFGETFTLDPKTERTKKFTWQKCGGKWLTK
jgi:glycosyltransferase involved in cell wall biosynthesis